MASGLDYKNLPQDVRPGDTLLLDDGRIVLERVRRARERASSTVVEQGGALCNNKGINRQAAAGSRRRRSPTRTCRTS